MDSWPVLGILDYLRKTESNGVIRAVGVLFLAVSCSGFFTSEKTTMPTVAHVPWVDTGRPIFLVAGSLFATQAVMSMLFVAIMGSANEICQMWGVRFHAALMAHAAFSTVGAFLYVVKYTCNEHLVINVEGHGEYLLGRNLHWLVSTPGQWYVFAQVTTRCSNRTMLPIYEATLFLQLHGILLLNHNQPMFRWFSFCVSCAHYAYMFWRVFELPIVRDMAGMAQRIRCVSLAIWSLYPMLILCRWANLLSPWSEQVLLFSVLDVSAKGVTFSVIIFARVMLVMAQINGTVQLVLSSQDVTIALDDNFCLIDDPEALPLFAPYFAGFTGQDDRKLLELCINEEHAQRLVSAGIKADSQHLGAPTPKVTVALRMPTGGGEMLVDCLVSKCLHGRRMIGFAVACRSEDPSAFMAEGTDQRSINSVGEESVSLGELAPTESSFTVTDCRNYDMQMIVALHNCNDVFELDNSVRTLVKKAFMQHHTAVFLFLTDLSAPSLETMVVVSSPLMQVHFEGAMPQPLGKLMNENSVDRVMAAVREEDYVLHQWIYLKLPHVVNRHFKLTMLPMNGLAGPDFVDNSHKLNLAVLDIMERSQEEQACGDREGYRRWKFTGGQLVVEGDTAACSDAKGMKAAGADMPRILVPLVEAFLSLACSRASRDR